MSDGSYDDGISTSACILTDIDNSFRTECANTVPGRPEEQDSCWAEMGGIKTIQLIVNATADLHDVTMGTVTQGCDSKAALLKSIMARRRPSPRKKHFDLASSIHNSRSRRIRVLPKWVRGHQDSVFLNQYLDRMALLNIRCNELAETARIAAQAG